MPVKIDRLFAYVCVGSVRRGVLHMNSQRNVRSISIGGTRYIRASGDKFGDSKRSIYSTLKCLHIGIVLYM